MKEKHINVRQSIQLEVVLTPFVPDGHRCYPLTSHGDIAATSLIKNDTLKNRFYRGASPTIHQSYSCPKGENIVVTQPKEKR